MFTGFRPVPPGHGWESEENRLDAIAEVNRFVPCARRLATMWGGLCPLDDVAVEAEVDVFNAPDWIVDKVECVRRFQPHHANLDYTHVECWPFNELRERLCESHAKWKDQHGEEDIPFNHVAMYVVKPRWNPEGLSMGARRVTPADIVSMAPNHTLMVQRYYQGLHSSTDYAVWKGKIQWGIGSRGYPYGEFGRFSHWDVGIDQWPREAFSSPETPLMQAVRKELPDYTGVLNVEDIGGSITEVHFRPSMEFFPLYGVEAATMLVRVGLGKGSRPDMPEVGRGRMLVEPRDAMRVDMRAEFAERSWRKGLVFIAGELVNT